MSGELLFPIWVINQPNKSDSHLVFSTSFGTRKGDCHFGSRESQDASPAEVTVTWKVESDAWAAIRHHINSMKIDFIETFELPLNVALLTEGEWRENESLYKDLLEIEIASAYR